MESIAAAFKSIFDKLSDFFNLFDLSFFVSGIVTATSIIELLRQFEITLDVSDGYRWFALIVFAYLSGLISFAIGSRIRMRRMKGTSNSDLYTAIKRHGAEEIAYFKEYKERADGGLEGLYTRMWTIVREMDDIPVSNALLKRYWVMTATYDGLAFSCICWVFNFFMYWHREYWAYPSHREWGIWVILFLGIGVVAFLSWNCTSQAMKYKRYQIEELTATFIEFYLKREKGEDI